MPNTPLTAGEILQAIEEVAVNVQCESDHRTWRIKSSVITEILEKIKEKAEQGRLPPSEGEQT